ncbi:TipAS antibiotic-recognition domain-containing protein [Nocardia sp. NPDC051990]|uniref:TipAS antibiotic-recognition domain-containing protein n=1 Tax=Nocardia sp. NPDC051990 TaxID=3155285 RepID=UPI003428656B
MRDQFQRRTHAAEIGASTPMLMALSGHASVCSLAKYTGGVGRGAGTMAVGDEARERWPEEFEQSRRNTATMTAEDVERMQRELTAAMIRMAEFMAAGTPVGDVVVQAEIDTQYQGICRFWTPNRDAYKCLGQIYVDDERFKANYEKIAEGLAEYQRDAMVVYAEERLGE